jgi:hypothetical protein
MSELLAKIPAWVLAVIILLDLALGGVMATKTWTAPTWVAVLAAGVGPIAGLAALQAPGAKERARNGGAS